MKKLPRIKKVILLLKFIFRNRYIPNIKTPKTFNEKIFHRIFNANDELFSLCSDKLAVKGYLKSKSLDSIIIEDIFESDSIAVDDVIKFIERNTEFILKANHNSGPVFPITSRTKKCEIPSIVNNLNHQLTLDYGMRYGERWYSDIKPKLFLERLIKTNDGSELKDYKFHVFQQPDGTSKIILHVDFDRTENHTRTYFDELLNVLPISSYVPSKIDKIDKPKNYEKMIEIAKVLAEPFDYVRVDLYNVDGEIYFGELTFAQGAGLSKFGSKEQDYLLGEFWCLDRK